MDIVIIGCGLISASHAQAIDSIDGAKLVAVCDIDVAVANKMALQYHCKAFDDAEAMLNIMTPDVAIICVPTYLHEYYTTLCATKNTHVLCEKPLERTAEACERLIRSVEENDIIFMTAQVVRFWSGYTQIKEMYDNGDIGEVYMMHLRRVSSRVGHYGSWLFNPVLGGGAMGDMLVHDIDFLRYIAGPFESCFANATKDNTHCYNDVMVSVIHQNGVRAVAEASLNMQTGYPFSFSVRIVGSEATVEYHYSAGDTIAERGESSNELKVWKKNEGLISYQLEPYDAYTKQLEYYLDCVKHLKQPELIPLHQSFEVISMMDAIQLSADTGAVVFCN